MQYFKTAIIDVSRFLNDIRSNNQIVTSMIKKYNQALLAIRNDFLNQLSNYVKFVDDKLKVERIDLGIDDSYNSKKFYYLIKSLNR